MARWLARQRYAASASMRLLRDQRWAATFTVLVLGVALALPLALGLLLLNARAGSADLPAILGLSVYLKPEVSEQKARELAASARARPDVAGVTLITAAQALQEFRARSDLGSALDALPDNPLPNVLEIIPKASTPAGLEALRTAFAVWPETDAVQLDRDWARRLDAMAALARQLLRLSAALLALAVVAIVGNTIRLEIQNRRSEIEIAQLVGGSNAFVRRPFLYLGALYGLAAALLAWGIVTLAGEALAAPVAQLAAAYGGRFTLRGPRPQELLALLASGMLLGWLGAAVAATRQLARMSVRPS